MSDSMIGAIVFLMIVILASPWLLMALAWWIRTFAAAWVVLVRRILGTHDKQKSFEDETMDLAHAKTEYGKMKREFDKEHERVSKSLAERRSKPL